LTGAIDSYPKFSLWGYSRRFWCDFWLKNG